MEKILKLYTYVDGTNDTPFSSADEQVIIGSFTYTANRMGSAPQITATVMHRLCLDDLWNDKVYAEFNGEKYFVINTPSSSKSNDDTRYEHDLELLSEREILNHVYFIDAVQGDSDTDVYKSNSTKVLFYGDIQQFVIRLNSSLSYSGLDYTAVIDEGISSEDKQVSFEDKYILEALQEEFNIFEIPYYFVGKVIHFGYTSGAITKVLKYGYDDALLSISKENANYQVINRITGSGSSDNIPYYYPNPSPKGFISAKAGETNIGVKDKNIIMSDPVSFSSINAIKPIEYETTESERTKIQRILRYDDGTSYTQDFPNTGNVTIEFEGYGYVDIPLELNYVYKIINGNEITLAPSLNIAGTEVNALDLYIEKIVRVSKTGTEHEPSSSTLKTFTFTGLSKDKEYTFKFYMKVKHPVDFTVIFDVNTVERNFWSYDDEEVELSDYGLSIQDGTTPSVGDTIRLNVDHYIPVSQNLMPSIYRETKGSQRFYNAKNNTYTNEEGEYYEFENEFSVNNIREGITSFDDIKPSIVEMENASGQRIDMFSEFAYDTDDNDEIDAETHEY